MIYNSTTMKRRAQDVKKGAYLKADLRLTAYGPAELVEPEDDSSEDKDEDLNLVLNRNLDLDRDRDSLFDSLVIVFRRVEIDAAAEFVAEKVDVGETFFDGTPHFQTIKNKHFAFFSYKSFISPTLL